MKKILLSVSVSIFLIACGGVRKSEKNLASGNYDQVIFETLDNLRTNKTADRKAPYIDLLKSAFDKAVARDERQLEFLKKEANPNTLPEQFEIITDLINRQERIRPILPLPKVKFNFKDYSDQTIAIKNKLSSFLLENSKTLLNSNLKADARQAYEDLMYLNSINPGYENINILLDEAVAKGTSYVRLSLVNETETALPQRLEDDLLNIDTYNLNEQWVQYHNRPLDGLNYDYDLILSFRAINVSPETLKERIVPQEKKIKDGFEYELDANGNVKKDSLGNDIKLDKYKTLKASLHEFRQSKNAQLSAQVDLIDLSTNQIAASFPLSDGYIFEHIYATYQGERDAIDPKMLKFLANKPIPFPSNEQMIYDSGESLKLLFKGVMVDQVQKKIVY